MSLLNIASIERDISTTIVLNFLLLLFHDIESRLSKFSNSMLFTYTFTRLHIIQYFFNDAIFQNKYENTVENT